MGFEIGAYASKLASTRPRTIEVVTEEAKDAVAQIATGFMDLGERLIEAKEMLPHGEWLPWLEREMHFSERTAQKYMAIARAYEGNPQLAADLGSEKAFALLALPMEEREQIAAEGATVNGKTKSPADLTTRDVKQIVAERKVVVGVDLAKGQSFSVDAAQTHLKQRKDETERFESLLYQYRKEFLKALSVCDSRQDGIFVLKERFKYSANGSNAGGWSGQPKGLGLHGGDFRCIERTWTEVWDMLAVMALQEVGRKNTEPEGQLVIAGYMPAGTNPGRESGLCVCMMQMDPEKEPAPMLLYWDGEKCEWQFKHGAAVEQEPVGWMRLPEWRN